MMNKRSISVGISGKQIFCDFSGFAGEECQQEEEKLRLLLQAGGVGTDEEEKNKKRAEAEPEANNEQQNIRA